MSTGDKHSLLPLRLPPYPHTLWSKILCPPQGPLSWLPCSCLPFSLPTMPPTSTTGACHILLITSRVAHPLLSYLHCSPTHTPPNRAQIPYPAWSSVSSTCKLSLGIPKWECLHDREISLIHLLSFQGLLSFGYFLSKK